jgi:hypothetical protein
MQKELELKNWNWDLDITTFSLDFFKPSLLEDSTPLLGWFSFFESGTCGEIDSRLRFFMAENENGHISTELMPPKSWRTDI